MKGKYRIIVENKKIRYDFEIKRNITIIKGDSATGKTTLADMIAEYEENGADSGIRLACDRECHILQGRYWKALLAEMKNSIIFIDEGNKNVSCETSAIFSLALSIFHSLISIPYSLYIPALA